MEKGRAAHIKPPFNNVAGEDPVNMLFTSTTVSQVHALPTSWADKYVHIKNGAGITHWFISKDPAAAVDNTVAATASGVTLTPTALGVPLSAGEKDWFVMPADGIAYLVRQSDSALGMLSLSVRSA